MSAKMKQVAQFFGKEVLSRDDFEEFKRYIVKSENSSYKFFKMYILTVTIKINIFSVKKYFR